MRTLPNRQQIPHETIHQLLSCQTEKKVITKSITPPRSTIRAEHYCAAPPLGSPQRSDDWPARIADLLGSTRLRWDEPAGGELVRTFEKHTPSTGIPSHRVPASSGGTHRGCSDRESGLFLRRRGA